uniref:Uncharacterized protein n=1 Tax=Arundo donax TaxID=35708 RepID=A0A0A8Y3J9_ARUDO
MSSEEKNAMRMLHCCGSFRKCFLLSNNIKRFRSLHL